MIEFFMKYIEAALPYIESIGPLMYLIIFAIALAEAIPVLGVATPGTALLIFFGYLASTQSVHVVPVIIVAFLGAVAGDLAGYFLGKYGAHLMEKHKKILTSAHLEAGRTFFNAHGGKSIFIARFFGPLRAIMSIIAGMSRMPFMKFNFYNVIGAIIWANLYILLGYYFGQEWRIIDAFISKFTMEAFVLLLIVVLVYLIRRKYKAEVISDIQNS